MSMREREGLIARIRHLRGSAASTEPDRSSPQHPADGVRLLEARITHLEHLVTGLQDSVHRESHRQAKLISELEARINPTALSKALSRDARERGL